MRQWLGPNPGARWKRLATFDGAVLQEIYRDTTAVVPAMLTVALVMFVSALGGLLWAVLEDVPDKLGFFLDSVVIGALVATGMFFVWAGLVAAMAGQVGRQDSAALTATVRTLSFATVPFTFSFFIFLPGLGYAVTLLSVGLLLLSTTLATQIALGTSLARALGSNLFGFVLWLIVLSALNDRDGQFAPPIFLWERFGL